MKKSLTPKDRREKVRLQIAEDPNGLQCLLHLLYSLPCFLPTASPRDQGTKYLHFLSDSSPRPKQIFKPGLQHHLLPHLFGPRNFAEHFARPLTCSNWHCAGTSLRLLSRKSYPADWETRQLGTKLTLGLQRKGTQGGTSFGRQGEESQHFI